MDAKKNHIMKVGADRRYTIIRKQALKQTERLLKMEKPNLRLTDIDIIALQAAQQWKGHPNRVVNWDWFLGHRHQVMQYPKRFEMATWNGKQLEALTMGRPTQSGEILRLDYIEASPFPRELKVLRISLIAMELYAELIGADELRIMYPISEGVKKYYESYGFTYYIKGKLFYLWKKL